MRGAVRFRRMDETAPESSQQAADAFGFEPAPWWRRLWRDDSVAPKRPARTIAVVTGLILLLLTGVVHGAGEKLGVFVLLAVPGFALERFYRARRRRAQEQLLPPL